MPHERAPASRLLLALLPRAPRACRLLLVLLLAVWTTRAEAGAPIRLSAEGQELMALLAGDIALTYAGTIDGAPSVQFADPDGTAKTQPSTPPDARVSGNGTAGKNGGFVFVVNAGVRYAACTSGVGPAAYLRIWNVADLDNWTEVVTHDAFDWWRVVGNGSYFWAINDAWDTLYKLNPADGATVTTWDVSSYTGVGLADLAISPDGLTLYLSFDGGGVKAIDLTGAGSLISATFIDESPTLLIPGQQKSLAVLADGTIVVVFYVAADAPDINAKVRTYQPDGTFLDEFVPDGATPWVEGIAAGASSSSFWWHRSPLDPSASTDGTGTFYKEVRLNDGAEIHGFRGVDCLTHEGADFLTYAPSVHNYVDTAFAVVPATLQPMPRKPPLAALTPCEPQSETGNGGHGKFGCNTGGDGWETMWDGDYDTTPDHDDPSPGEPLTDKLEVDFFIEVHLADSTIHRRAFTELAHPPTYEGGRKREGLKAISAVEHALGNELGAFETGDVTIEYADQADRLVRILLDGSKTLKGCKLFVKACTPEGVRLNLPATILARSVIQRARLSAPMTARIEAVDQISANVQTRKYPHWQVKDAIPDANPASLEELLTPLYGEKSDEGADPVSRALIPGIIAKRYDLSGAGLATPPDTPGYEFEALVAALQASMDGDTVAADWGSCIGAADAAVLDAMTTCPSDYFTLGSIIGYSDLDALLSGDCGGGTTAAPDDTGWMLVIFGLAEWAKFKVYGSDLQGGDATTSANRVFIDHATRADILHPDGRWPHATRHVEVVNPDTGRTFWLTACYIRGALLDDVLSGKITLACNAVGIMGNAGLPIIDAHLCEQHWQENFVHRDWTSGPWADESDYPQWENGIAQVKSSSFKAAQALTATRFGGRGLTCGWFPRTSKTHKEWIDQWDRETCSKTGISGDWQTFKYRFDPSVDASTWRRIDHVEHVFGRIESTPGQDPMNVATGYCDWDPDAQKFRVGPITRRNADGLTYANDEELAMPVLEGEILNRVEQLQWVLDEHLLLLRFGSTFMDVPGPIGFWDDDVGTGAQITTIEGAGAFGYVRRMNVALRRRFDLDSRIVTKLFWDVEQLLDVVT